MTPLQKIGMGMVIVVLPAYFPRDPHPPWRYYDALPDPIGWLLVIAGVVALGRAAPKVDLDWARWAAVLALLVSIPLWFPQLNHLLVPRADSSRSLSLEWVTSLPQMLFGLALCRAVGAAALAQPERDRLVVGRFGVLTWGFVASAVLPVVVYGGGVRAIETPTLILIGLVQVVFCYYLFRVSGRRWLGGIERRRNDSGTTKAAPGEPGRPS